MDTTRRSNSNRRNSAGNIGLWTLQALLAALFVCAGSMKFAMPIEDMTRQIPFPAWFLYFIGVCELLGGLGLILPAALRIRPWLTPLAAALLVPIMLGATVLSVISGGIAAGVLPFVLGAACGFVAQRRGSAYRRDGAHPASERPLLHTAR